MTKQAPKDVRGFMVDQSERDRRKLAKLARAGTERDDDQAILPDGSRCDWDERLRTVGAHRVRRI